MNNKYLVLSAILVCMGTAIYGMEDGWQDSSAAEIEEALRQAQGLSSQPFEDVDIAVGRKYFQFGGKVSLECFEAGCNFDTGISNRYFKIKSRKESAEVGHIDILYRPRDKTVEIAYMQVLPQYRRQGYGEAALRDILGVYRNPDYSYLDFDYFTLSVQTDDDHLPARNLYNKIGFEIEEVAGNILFNKMRLKR